VDPALDEKIATEPPASHVAEPKSILHGRHAATTNDGDSVRATNDDRRDEQLHPIHQPRFEERPVQLTTALSEEGYDATLG
jgi:hypothetical protein